jgi:hypothetical protein
MRGDDSDRRAPGPSGLGAAGTPSPAAGPSRARPGPPVARDRDTRASARAPGADAHVRTGCAGPVQNRSPHRARIGTGRRIRALRDPPPSSDKTRMSACRVPIRAAVHWSESTSKLEHPGTGRPRAAPPDCVGASDSGSTPSGRSPLPIGRHPHPHPPPLTLTSPPPPPPSPSRSGAPRRGSVFMARRPLPRHRRATRPQPGPECTARRRGPPCRRGRACDRFRAGCRDRGPVLLSLPAFESLQCAAYSPPPPPSQLRSASPSLGLRPQGTACISTALAPLRLPAQ